MVLLRVGDDGGQGSLTARTRSSRHGNEQGQAHPYLEDALHVADRRARTGYAAGSRLGTVHGTATPQGDDGLRPAVEVELAGLLHILYRGVGHRAVIDGIRYARSLEFFLHHAADAGTHQSLVGDDEDAAYPPGTHDVCHAVQRVIQFWLTVGQDGDDHAECCLVGSAPKFL